MSGKCNFNYEDECLTKYFKDVKKSVLLTSDEEVSLAKRIINGDEKAVDELVKANLKFVVSIAKDYQGQGLSLSDLISEGNYGLVKAAYRFDHTRGFKFISYAVWWVKQSILQSLNDNARTVRLPNNIITKLSYLKKKIEEFESANEREPVYGDIYDINNETMEILNFPKCASLNDLINDDGDELIELIGGEEIDEGFINDKIKDELRNTLSVLDEREREIIECYFGINTGCEPMTLEAIGDKFSITKERVRQLKRASIKKIRNNSSELFNVLQENY